MKKLSHACSCERKTFFVFSFKSKADAVKRTHVSGRNVVSMAHSRCKSHRLKRNEQKLLSRREINKVANFAD